MNLRVICWKHKNKNKISGKILRIFAKISGIKACEQKNKQNKCKGLSFFIQRCECYSRCDWSLPMIYWSANTCMDDVTGKLFYLLCSTWRAVLNMLVRLFRIKQVKTWKPPKKFSRSYLQRRKMEKRRQKEFLTTWECLNCKKSSQQLPSCVIAPRDSLFRKIFSPLICFELEKTLKKNLSMKLYTKKIKKKRRKRKTSAWDLNNV